MRHPRWMMPRASTSRGTCPCEFLGHLKEGREARGAGRAGTEWTLGSDRASWRLFWCRPWRGVSAPCAGDARPVKIPRLSRVKRLPDAWTGCWLCGRELGLWRRHAYPATARIDLVEKGKLYNRQSHQQVLPMPRLPSFTHLAQTIDRAGPVSLGIPGFMLLPLSRESASGRLNWAGLGYQALLSNAMEGARALGELNLKRTVELSPDEVLLNTKNTSTTPATAANLSHWPCERRPTTRPQPAECIFLPTPRDTMAAKKKGEITTWLGPERLPSPP